MHMIFHDSLKYLAQLYTHMIPCSKLINCIPGKELINEKNYIKKLKTLNILLFTKTHITVGWIYRVGLKLLWILQIFAS